MITYLTDVRVSAIRNEDLRRAVEAHPAHPWEYVIDREEGGDEVEWLITVWRPVPDADGRLRGIMARPGCPAVYGDVHLGGPSGLVLVPDLDPTPPAALCLALRLPWAPGITRDTPEEQEH